MGQKKRHFGQITAIIIPKCLLYPAFAVQANIPFPLGNGRTTVKEFLTSN